MSIVNQPIAELPVAVVDVETTGLTAGHDRVVEISVVRCDPGSQPTLVFDSLVNPLRPMAATEIHGISDADVAEAPTFRDIAGDVLTAVSGCAIAAYNVYFDIDFLRFELNQVGVRDEAPHFCLMYMRPMLGLGKRCKLQQACIEHNIPYTSAHVAGADAEAEARLFQLYLREIERRGICTYGDLSKLKSYKFLSSFRNSPLSNGSSFRFPKSERICSRYRAKSPTPPPLPKSSLAQYWDSICTAIADLQVDDQEIVDIVREREGLGLSIDQVRYIHAQIFAAATAKFGADKIVDDREALKLRRLSECLRQLGWAPGD